MYESNDDFIIYRQIPRSMTSDQINTEDIEVEFLLLNNHEAFYFSNQGMQ